MKVRTTREDEYRMQATFFAHVLDSHALRDLPIYAVPNFAGHYGTALQRVIAGSKAKKSGRRKGVPDVIVDVPHANAHGLRIEFKVENKQPEPEQDDWHGAMRVHGYCVVVSRSAEHALRVLQDYVSGGTLAMAEDALCEAERVVRMRRREQLATRKHTRRAVPAATSDDAAPARRRRAR